MNPLLPVAMVVQRILADVPLRVEDAEMAKIPAKGPMILAANHINAMEVPTMLSHLWPRKATGLAKSEAWRNPLFRLLYWIYRAVPIRRGEVDMNAMKLCIERLAEGYVLAIAPEGTRSHNGQLQEAKPGIVLLAVKSGSPIQPMAYFGHENIWKNLSHFKRTPFTIRVGSPFTIDLHGERLNKENSQVIANQVMYQIAALMPPRYRGVYADLSQASDSYLKFVPGGSSSLARVAEMDAFPARD